jgi:hypothetical protein
VRRRYIKEAGQSGGSAGRPLSNNARNEEYNKKKGERRKEEFFLTEKLPNDTREPLERDDGEEREGEGERGRERTWFNEKSG